MTLTTLALLGFAFSLDLLFGGPPNGVRPAARFGRFVGVLDRTWSDDEHRQRLVGAAVAVLVPLVPALVAAGSVLAATAFHPMAGAVVAGVVLYLATDLHSVLALAQDVVTATDGDLETARERVRGLAGGDASTLSAAEMRSRVLEGAARGLATGLVAPLLPFALLAPLSIPAATAVAAWVAAVTTLEATLGESSNPAGVASARLAALVLWLPARVTAAAIAVAAADPLALRRARRSAQPTSPSTAAWPGATLACALSVRLAVPTANDPNAGADPPTLEDGERAVTVVGLAAVVAIVIAVGLAVLSPTVAGALESLR